MSESAPVAPAETRCAVHPEVVCDQVCGRCGDYMCGECATGIDNLSVCAECKERVGDWLEEFKQELWGKRDGWVWLLGGCSSAFMILLIMMQAPTGISIDLVFSLAQLGVLISYFMLKKWARAGLFLIPLMAFIQMTAMVTGAGPAAAGQAFALAVFWPLIIFTVAFFDNRNRLTFRIEIPRKKLEKLYSTYYDNQLARMGLILGLLSLVVPLLSILSMILSIVGLHRVDPNSRPPVGRRGSAIAGIIFSSLGLCITIAIAVAVTMG